MEAKPRKINQFSLPEFPTLVQIPLAEPHVVQLVCPSTRPNSKKSTCFLFSFFFLFFLLFRLLFPDSGWLVEFVQSLQADDLQLSSGVGLRSLWLRKGRTPFVFINRWRQRAPGTHCFCLHFNNPSYLGEVPSALQYYPGPGTV